MSPALSCNGKSALILVDFQRVCEREREGTGLTPFGIGAARHTLQTHFSRGEPARCETAEDPHAFLRYPKHRFIKIYLEKRCISVITTFQKCTKSGALLNSSLLLVWLHKRGLCVRILVSGISNTGIQNLLLPPSSSKAQKHTSKAFSKIFFQLRVNASLQDCICYSF